MKRLQLIGRMELFDLYYFFCPSRHDVHFGYCLKESGEWKTKEFVLSPRLFSSANWPLCQGDIVQEYLLRAWLND